MTRRNILDVGRDGLESFLVQRGYQRYGSDQVFGFIMGRSVVDFDLMRNLPQKLRSELKEEFHFGLEDSADALSLCDGTVKFLVRLEAGDSIESVLMDYEHGLSACISTQVGCKMGCVFCASGSLGFVRDLSSGEMILQVLVANGYLRERVSDEDRKPSPRVSNLVLMGIGEPLDNLTNVEAFLRNANDPNYLGISYRRMTVSTVGFPARIRQLGSLRLPVNLAVSLHSATDQLRRVLVPASRSYSVDELVESASEYSSMTSRRVTYEYTLIDGVNDSDEEARRLVRLLSGRLCHVNLIPLNENPSLPYRRSRRSREFSSVLSDSGISVTVRRELGTDIRAACGQLRAGQIKL